MSNWLTVLSIVSLCIAGASALVVVLDLISGHKQHMWVMNIVWPITCLYSGPIGLILYFKWGRLSTQKAVRKAKSLGKENPGKKKPFWQITALGATHCGGGCTLGDLIAEWIIFFAPFTLFGKKIFAAWLLDYAFAFILGIAFQYFTMRGGLKRAIKADSLSLSTWQLGMYGWMAIATFAIFGHELEKTSPVFWFMMQIAMCFGFLSSYPVNWWLIKKGIKEKM